MIRKNRLIALFVAFSLGISSLGTLPVKAAKETVSDNPASDATDPDDAASNTADPGNDDPADGPENGSTADDPDSTDAGLLAWKTNDELLEQNHTMEFLALINKERLKKKLPPLVVIDTMQEAAQTRAKELETQCSEIRPDSEKPWYTVFADAGTVHDMKKITDAKKRLYSASEFRASGAKTAAAMYEEWMDNSTTKTSLLKSTLTHMGLGHTDGTLTINGKEDTDPWVLLLIGKYKPDALMLKDPGTIPTVPKGLSIDDMGLILKLRSKSPENYPCVGELPILSEMCTGYDSNKTGTQKVTVKYRYSSTVSLTTTFKVNVEKATPEVPTIFNATGTSYNTVTVKWSPVEKATSYKIYRSTKKTSGYKAVATLKETSLNEGSDGLYTYKDSGRTSGQLYYYKIKAYAGSSGSEYSSWDDAKPNVDAPASVKVTKKSATSAKVSWKKVSHATSYRVYYATSKNGHYKRAGITSKTSFTIRNMSRSKKKFYIKVLSYRKSRPGKYSKIVTKKMR